MSGIEIADIIAISLWVLLGAGVGVFAGFICGRKFTISNESGKLEHERRVIQDSLVQLIDSTQKMTVDVGQHSQKLAHVEKDVKEIQAEDDLQLLQSKLLQNIDSVVQSNQRMENDLAITKYQLENQAQELDRSKKEARTDGLCNVGNRKAFEEAINYMICRYRVDGTSFALMLVDLDYFKRINDTFGHQAGDEVLISVGKALNECVRPDDVVTRIGGDEFAILLKGVDHANSNQVGSRIRQTMDLYNFSIGDGKNASTVVTTSMGMAMIQESDSAADLYKRADKALYRSKEFGRNRLTTSEREEQNTVEASEKNDADLFPSMLPTDTLNGSDQTVG
jgi:diguanylate cyclase